jgi:hypothetical protein
MSFLTGTQAELLYAMPTTGGSITGTVSTAGTNALTPQQGATTPTFQLPAYFFPATTGTGKSLLVQGGGTLLNGAATQTMRFALYLNSTQSTQGVLLCATGLFSPFGTTVSQTGTFMFEVLITCTAVGTAGTLNSVGRIAIGPSANTATNVNNVTMLMSSSTQPVVNTTVAQFIEAYAHFGATTTTQAATLTNFFVWGLN